MAAWNMARRTCPYTGAPRQRDFTARWKLSSSSSSSSSTSNVTEDLNLFEITKFSFSFFVFCSRTLIILGFADYQIDRSVSCTLLSSCCWLLARQMWVALGTARSIFSTTTRNLLWTLNFCQAYEKVDVCFSVCRLLLSKTNDRSSETKSDLCFIDKAEFHGSFVPKVFWNFTIGSQ